jgi:hypothetical protein
MRADALVPPPWTRNARVLELRERDRAVIEPLVDRRRRAAVVAVDVEAAQRRVDDEVAGGEVAGPRGRRLHPVVLQRRGDADVVDAPRVAAAGDDVDRAGDRARAGLRCRRAQDLDPLDLVGRNRVEREARRHALAVEQDLGVAVAESAKPDRAAAPRTALDRDAGQPLEHIAERRVAELVDLVAADDDLGGRRIAPLLHVVGTVARDLHRVEPGAIGAGRRVAARRRRCIAGRLRSGVSGDEREDERSERDLPARADPARACDLLHPPSLSSGCERSLRAHPKVATERLSRRQRPTARSSSALFIFERPLMLALVASA